MGKVFHRHICFILLAVLTLLTPSVAGAQTLMNGAPVTGTITGPSVDTYTFPVATGGTVASFTIREVGPDTAFVPFVFLYNPSGTLYTGASGNPLYGYSVFFAPTAGTWTAKVSTNGGATGGNYSLLYIGIPGPLGNCCGQAGGPMTPGQIYSGSIYRGQMDMFSFTTATAPPGAGTPVVSLSFNSSSGMGAWMRVYDKIGNLESQLISTNSGSVTFGPTGLAAGTYSVIISRRDGHDGTVPYTVSVEHGHLS